ncbi:hypothetical protein ADUPG1_010335, partial [Aduncisulcus paluster]
VPYFLTESIVAFTQRQSLILVSLPWDTDSSHDKSTFSCSIPGFMRMFHLPGLCKEECVMTCERSETFDRYIRTISPGDDEVNIYDLVANLDLDPSPRPPFLFHVNSNNNSPCRIAHCISVPYIVDLLSDHMSVHDVIRVLSYPWVLCRHWLVEMIIQKIYLECGDSISDVISSSLSTGQPHPIVVALIYGSSQSLEILGTYGVCLSDSFSVVLTPSMLRMDDRELKAEEVILKIDSQLSSSLLHETCETLCPGFQFWNQDNLQARINILIEMYLNTQVERLFRL